MLEKAIEQYLCKRVKDLGGIPFKFSSPNRRSVPDRLCVFHYGLIVFVECKAPGKTATPAQQREMDRLYFHGHNVWIIDSKRRVEKLIDYIRGRLDELKSSI